MLTFSMQACCSQPRLHHLKTGRSSSLVSSTSPLCSLTTSSEVCASSSQSEDCHCMQRPILSCKKASGPSTSCILRLVITSCRTSAVLQCGTGDLTLKHAFSLKYDWCTAGVVAFLSMLCPTVNMCLLDVVAFLTNFLELAATAA
jgi:hypothetical protein